MRVRLVGLLLAVLLVGSMTGSPPVSAAPPATAGSVVGAFGDNAYGQLGDGSLTDHRGAVQAGVPDAIAIAAGEGHSLAVRPDGTVWSWGGNGFGQLGDGTTTNRSTPAEVPGVSGAVAVAAGNHHSVALLSDGTVMTWGDNTSGQIGDGTNTQRTTPVTVGGLTGVTAIAASGGDHTLALLTNGTVRAWGYNGLGQLGDNSTTNRTTPVAVSGLSGVTGIAAGGMHSHAVLSDGTVRAWGWNLFGQLGDGTTTTRTTPVTVSGLTGVASVADGRWHSLALLNAGTVRAWGQNDDGRLGDGTTTQRTSPVTVTGLNGVAAIDAGGSHSLAVLTNGGARAWGLNSDGQLGDGTNTNRSTPVAVSDVSGVTAISAGGQSSLHLANPAVLRVVTSPAVPSQISIDGNIADTYGLSYMKILPASHTVSFDRVEGYTTPLPITQTIPSGVTTTVTGTFAQRGYLRVTTQPAVPGTIWVDGKPRQDWGMWTDFPVGTYEVCFGAVPGYQFPPCESARVLAGDTTTVTGNYTADPAAIGGATVGAVGKNGSGQLGDTTTTNHSITFQSSVPDAIAVAAGDIHSLALRPDGTVWAWGHNGYGQLGDGSTTNRDTPQPVPGLTGVTAIAAGETFSLALIHDGTVRAWGRNQFGQLGTGDTTDRTSPVTVVGLLSPVAAISAGGSHSLAVLTSGTVRAWGKNTNGELGDGTTTHRSTPTLVSGLGGVSAVAAGRIHSLARRTDGTVAGWGGNLYGEVGDGTQTERHSPVVLAGLDSVTSIAAGDEQSLAVRGDGTIRAWGVNGFGQGFDGTTFPRTSPVNPGLTDVVSVATGGRHSLALLSDGTVRAAGENDFGELGNGTTTNSTAIVTVTGVAGVTGLAAGLNHSLFMSNPAILRVVSSPAVPTQISIDGKIGDTYGISYMKLFPGPHFAQFGRVEAFDTPGPVIQTLLPGETTITGTFTQRGYLRVLTSPAVPGTIWVDGSPRQDWGMWTDVPVGNHTVCFGSIAGYHAPSCQLANVVAGATTTITGEYTN